MTKGASTIRKWLSVALLSCYAAAALAAPSSPDDASLDQLINEVAPFHDVSAKRVSDDEAAEVIMHAMGLIGIAYRYGGTSPKTGFDCSGFMQYIFKKALGVNLPRTSAQMATVGIPVSRTNLKPGDLLFFAHQGKRVSHVGMYIGDNKMIHAPRTGKNIEISNINIPYWVKRFVVARRVTGVNRAEQFLR